eukprot:IDg23081t1
MPEKECLAVIYAIQICRPYIQGEYFTVYTDCSALRWLFEINDPSGRLMRWRLRLAEYRFKTEYRKGIKNCQGDAMSRLASNSHTTVDIDEEIPAYSDDLTFEADLATDWHDDELVPLDAVFATTEQLPEAAEPLLIEEILREQARDEFCERLRALVEVGATSVYTEDPETGLIVRTLHQPQQIVVPESLRLRALNLFHRPITAGHPGGKKMYTTLRRNLYWPGMALDCYQHVRSCPECARERVRLRRYATELQLFPPSAPLDSIAMDLLGPFPPTKLGNTHLLVITDRFTKLTRTIPLARTRAWEVANAFAKNWVFIYGAPTSILTDNGPPFNSKFYQEVCSCLGIKCLFTTTYHPRANGQAERFNRTILSAIRSYVADHPQLWDVYS